jgi:hypothetical protein
MKLCGNAVEFSDFAGRSLAQNIGLLFSVICYLFLIVHMIKNSQLYVKYYTKESHEVKTTARKIFETKALIWSNLLAVHYLTLHFIVYTESACPLGEPNSVTIIKIKTKIEVH